MTTLQTRPAHTTNAERHAALAGAWLMSLGSEHTRRAYRGDILGLFAFLDAGDLDALDAERRHIDAYRLTLTGAPSTVARKLAAASSFYSYASAEGAMPRAESHPVSRVVRPRVDADHSDTRGLSEAEAHAYLDAARQDGARSYALVALLLTTGARISEVLGADVSDLQHDTGHRVLVVTRKGGKRAKLPLPPRAVDALGEYLGASAAHGAEIVAADTASDDAPLFTTATGKRWAASEAFRTVQRIARRAGIDGAVSPHSLRHTHATIALAHGVALADLQDSMGHADPRTTRRYDRARGRLERSSAYAVASVLG
ncbi:tyrosine-type recombinase/integrase [uncultured Microbacterium sp.]|uniref:tyrosine-type recombinase/integrase n=1 Tax=uncultured Microbacterium sp. TaxID=191216 RepID=UPI00260ED181|nr:tyrosine-type recombinase/integrase [uncultured Microbacterium sp.]